MARVGNNLNQILPTEIHLYKYGGCDLPSISEPSRSAEKEFGIE